MDYELSRIALLCEGILIGHDRRVTQVVTDSRSVCYDGMIMFVAMSGANHDGHSYIEQMYRRGVRAFMVEHAPKQTDIYPDATFVVVRNSLEALQRLAAEHRRQFRGTVIGITGSNGKTIVKEWIGQLAPEGMKIFRSPKSYNSQLGVALSLLMLKGDEDLAIIEAGISKPGEMQRLEVMIRPDIGVFTTLGDAHQENFSTLGQKAREKNMLFRSSRVIIYNGKYHQIEETLGKYPGSKIDIQQRVGTYEIPFKDGASQENVALAVAALQAAGIDSDTILKRITSLQPVAMRLELKEGINNSIIVNDTYNSDINSLGIALDYLRNVAGTRPMTLILSDILQSGLRAEELYRMVAEKVASAGIDLLIGIGDTIRQYAGLFGCRTEFYATTDQLLESLRHDHTSHRAILIKGNRASRFERISHALQLRSHTTTLEVDLDALINNLNYFRSKLSAGTKLMAMVKASSYGHGGYEVANTLQQQGVDYLAVAFADEGVILRRQGISMPIVVLNADSDSFDVMVAHGLEPEIYNFTSLRSFIDIVRRGGERHYPIHIKLDTGMNRLGFKSEDIATLVSELNAANQRVHVQSIFSHFAVADEADGERFTMHQFEIFQTLSGSICNGIGYTPMRHIANSAAIERFPETHLDMCRLGIGLYCSGCGLGEGKLLNVGSLRTRIVHVKQVDPTQSVGYGREGHTSRTALIATIPIGYADGLDRHLGCGRWSMLVNGKEAPTVGRICMDTCMIDVSDCDAKEGDQVIIYGKTQGHTVSDMAVALDTIPYEIMTSVSSRVKRIYIKE